MKIWFIALALVAAVLPARADKLVSDRADHVILVTIESDPPGAEIYSIPATTNEAPARIGATPHVALVELRWGSGMLRKKWRKLSVKTIGNICQLDYDKKEKRYDLAMKFKVSAPGCLDAYAEEQVASFAYYNDLEFDNLKGIPNKASVRVELKSTEADGGRASRKSAPSTVMIAGEGEQGKFGTLQLEANVAGADVIVDGKPAGVVPVRLILREGDHDVVVQARGYRMYQSRVSISPDSEMKLRASLEAAK